MSQLVDMMKKRHNTQFFSSEIPDKKIIDDILKTAHDLTPHKNNFYRYKINVWGPEHKEQKRWVGISSVGGEGKDKFRDNLDKEKFDELGFLSAYILEMAQHEEVLLRRVPVEVVFPKAA